MTEEIHLGGDNVYPGSESGRTQVVMRNTFQAIAFDFGNTLCPWDDAQYWQVTRGALEHVCSYAPGSTFEQAYEAFSRYRMEECVRNLPRLRENDLPGMLRRTAEELSGRSISESELADIVRAQTEAFVRVCHAPEGLPAVLERLSHDHILAVLSNYSLPAAIRLSLEKMGIDKYFHTIMVSADLGIIKPSRELFGELLVKLDVPPEKALFVGDDWLADVVGASACGMPVVQVTGNTTEDFAERMNAIFNGYIRQVLDLPEYRPWRNAEPLAVLGSVFDLERWLRG